MLPQNSVTPCSCEEATRRHAKRQGETTCGGPPRSACTKQSTEEEPKRRRLRLHGLELNHLAAKLASSSCDDALLSSAAAQNHKLQTGYYTAARLGANHFAANSPLPLARPRPKPKQTCAAQNGGSNVPYRTEEAICRAARRMHWC